MHIDRRHDKMWPMNLARESASMTMIWRRRERGQEPSRVTFSSVVNTNRAESEAGAEVGVAVAAAVAAREEEEEEEEEEEDGGLIAL